MDHGELFRSLPVNTCKMPQPVLVKSEELAPQHELAVVVASPTHGLLLACLKYAQASSNLRNEFGGLSPPAFQIHTCYGSLSARTSAHVVQNAADTEGNILPDLRHILP